MSATRRDGPDGRFYEVDGHLYPSVTHILTAINKPALVPWAANQERTHVSEAAADLYEQWAQLPDAQRVPLPRSAYLATLKTRLGQVRAHERTLTKAGDVGTEAHKLIEWTLRQAIGAEAGPRPIASDGAEWAFRTFMTWAHSVQLKPVLIERTVYSKTHGFAGTVDAVARVHGILTALDFKTGKAIYAEAYLQSAAYRAALDEMGYHGITAGLIIRLPKVVDDPGFEVAEVPPIDNVFPVFLAAKDMWSWQYANEAAFRARRAGSKKRKVA